MGYGTKLRSLVLIYYLKHVIKTQECSQKSPNHLPLYTPILLGTQPRDLPLLNTWYPFITLVQRQTTQPPYPHSLRNKRLPSLFETKSYAGNVMIVSETCKIALYVLYRGQGVLFPILKNAHQVGFPPCPLKSWLVTPLAVARYYYDHCDAGLCSN